MGTEPGEADEITVSASAPDTKEVIARFESERQALALMDHPNIAKVFAAGATDRGRPYFVMEYVPGIAITDYCNKHLLDNRQSLDLFLQVCNAVQHAHQKGIIHRDIKPSNVLVSIQDGKPVPKVIVPPARGGRLPSCRPRWTRSWPKPRGRLRWRPPIGVRALWP